MQDMQNTQQTALEQHKAKDIEKVLMEILKSGIRTVSDSNMY